MKKLSILAIVVVLGTFSSNFGFAGKIIVIRHGEAVHNIKGIFSSKLSESHKYPLTEKGKTQVREAGVKLENDFQYSDKNVSALYYSPFLRTQETAQILGSQLHLNKIKLIPDSLLVDIDMGLLEARPETELLHYCPVEPCNMTRSIVSQFHGESTEEVSLRVRKFLGLVHSKTSDSNSVTIVVTHASPAVELIRALSHSSSEIIPEPKNAEIKIFDF